MQVRAVLIGVFGGGEFPAASVGEHLSPTDEHDVASKLIGLASRRGMDGLLGLLGSDGTPAGLQGSLSRLGVASVCRLTRPLVLRTAQAGEMSGDNGALSVSRDEQPAGAWHELEDDQDQGQRVSKVTLALPVAGDEAGAASGMREDDVCLGCGDGLCTRCFMLQDELDWAFECRASMRAAHENEEAGGKVESNSTKTAKATIFISRHTVRRGSAMRLQEYDDGEPLALDALDALVGALARCLPARLLRSCIILPAPTAADTCCH